MALTGGCFCGRIRYVVEGPPLDATICRCAYCQRATGSPVVGWLSVRPSELRFVVEVPRHFGSSPGVVRSFCTNCGTSLTYRRSELDEIDVTIFTLDDPKTVPPRSPKHTDRIVDWVKPAASLPDTPSHQPHREPW